MPDGNHNKASRNKQSNHAKRKNPDGNGIASITDAGRENKKDSNNSAGTDYVPPLKKQKAVPVNGTFFHYFLKILFYIFHF